MKIQKGPHMTAHSNHHLKTDYNPEMCEGCQTGNMSGKQRRHKHSIKRAKPDIELYILKCCLQHCTPIKDDNIILQKRKWN